MLSSTKYKGNNEHYNRASCLNYIIAPSILGKINCHLEKLSEFDFNIFELNDLIKEKSTFYIAYEIFSRYNFFSHESDYYLNYNMHMNSIKIEESNFNNFINEVISGYDRKVLYHNDLHAGDVLQTIYLIIENGDLQNVKLV
jgi:hypothetical protein